MKLKTALNTLGSLAIAALLASCSGQPSDGKPLEKMGATTGSDSVSYYYGQLMAERMFQMSQQDSLFKDPKFLDAYWKGMKEAQNLLRQGDSPEDKGFNQGLAFGLQLYENMLKTSKDIPEFKFNPKMFEAGYAWTHMGDSVRSTTEAQGNLSQIMESMQKRATAKDNAMIEKNIAEYAKKHGFAKDKAGYFEKMVKQGNGQVYAVGDSLTISVEFATSTGRDMKQYAMPETPLVLGKTMPMTYPYAQVLLNTRGNSVLQLLMVPDALFGGATQSFGFEKGEFLIVTLNTKFVAKTSYKPEGAPSAAPAPGDAKTKK